MFRFIPQSAWHNGRGWDFQIWRLASQAHYGGGHLSEIARAIERLESDSSESWFREWTGLGEQLVGMANEVAARSHDRTAADRFLRASNYFRMAEFFLEAGDGRKLETFRASVQAFQNGIRIGARRVEPVRVKYESTTLKGYWCTPGNDPGIPPRAIVFIGGLDSTAEELYFTGLGLIDRGYHVLIIEGPGQGEVLREQGLPARHDYEGVGSAAYDWVSARPETRSAPIALIGMSLGGYYSLRIAAFEHRYSALVSWSPIENYAEFWKDRTDDHNLAPHLQWVMGVSSMRDARERIQLFDVSDILHGIACPTLLCVAELDGSPLSLRQSKSVFKKLSCPKTWHLFTEERGGALHCQQDHLTLANEVIGDWLDETLR